MRQITKDGISNVIDLVIADRINKNPSHPAFASIGDLKLEILQDFGKVSPLGFHSIMDMLIDRFTVWEKKHGVN